MSGPVRTVAAALAALLLSVTLLADQWPPFGGAAAFVSDLQARRARVLAAMPPDSILVLWSAPPRVYSTDTNYPYRQESNLLYLSGLSQEETTLVLVKSAAVARALLFVRESDPARELWDGHSVTVPEAVERTGIADVVPQQGTAQFDALMSAMLGGAGTLPSWLEPVRQASRSGRVNLGVVGRVDEDTDVARWLQAMQRQSPAVAPFSAGPILGRLRSIKTPYEQDVLRRSVAISAEAHVRGMRSTRPGVREYEVQAAIEYGFLSRGALSWGYPSIVASGPNATTLHYSGGTRELRAGDLLLVDAAGNFQGLTGDITRTYPVSGRFTPEQRRVYDLILRAADAGRTAARPGASTVDVTLAVRKVIGVGLLELGLITDPQAALGTGEQIDWWFPHGPIHGIGVDVHDPLGRLDPGAAFVIEPGLYFRRDTFARLSTSRATADVARRIAGPLARYLDMGVRLEDSFLMSPGGPEMLSSSAPRLPDEIERTVGVER